LQASKILGPRFSDLSGRSLSTEIQTAAHIVIVFIGEGRGAATASHACCHLDFGRRHDSPSPSPVQAGLRLVVLGSSSCRTYGGIPHSTGRFNMADSDLQLLHAAWLAMRQDVPRVRSRRSLSPNGAAGRSPNAGRARPGGAGWLDDKSLTHHVASEHEYPHGFRARLSGTGVSRDLPVVCRTRDGFRLVRVALPRQQVSVLARIGTPDLARPIGKGPTATIVNGWGCHGALVHPLARVPACHQRQRPGSRRQLPCRVGSGLVYSGTARTKCQLRVAVPLFLAPCRHRCYGRPTPWLGQRA